MIVNHAVFPNKLTALQAFNAMAKFLNDYYSNQFCRYKTIITTYEIDKK
jgi:hypothetical protein